MITPAEYEVLRSDEVQRAIAAQRGRDPLAVALDSAVPHARLVATQVKYLARAAAKLPSYAAAQCILPPRAFEQASSEACAAHKLLAGDTVLDLTCGLGVDALFLSRRFRHVVALERDPVLADIARENFRRLGARNIEVVSAPAESYLRQLGLRFDWIYADPDRRSESGRKLVRLEECSPDMVALMPLLERASGRLCVKNSPLFDVGEALRLFPRSRVEVVSLGGECKEVVIYADGTGPAVTATALGPGNFTALPVEEAATGGENYAALTGQAATTAAGGGKSAAAQCKSAAMKPEPGTIAATSGQETAIAAGGTGPTEAPGQAAAIKPEPGNSVEGAALGGENYTPLTDQEAATAARGGNSAAIQCTAAATKPEPESYTALTSQAAATAAHREGTAGYGSFTATPGEAAAVPDPGPFDPARYRWLVVPDVALQKARLARLHLAGRADIWSENGYGFAAEEPRGIIGRVFAIGRIEPYDVRRLRRALKGCRAEVMKRDFPFAAEEAARRLGVRQGADVRLALTKIGGSLWAIRLE